MKKMIMLMLISLSLVGCSTYIANAPFDSKSVPDKAITMDGNIEYSRTVKVTPAKALIPVIITNTDKTVSIKTIPPELIIAGAEAAAKVIIPTITSIEKSYVDLRGASLIEVQETYKRTSK